MPSRQTVEAFVALVEAGDYVGAIEHFYAPDASTRENTGEPVVGRDVLMAKERGVMARFRKIEASRIGPVLIEGDTVTARWKFTFTGADGSSRHPGRNRLADLARRQADRGAFLLRSASNGAVSRGL
jgi:ketosteroid isomerase-like protein